MPHRGPALALLLATAVGGTTMAAPADGARRHATCKHARSKTIAQNASVRVYRVAHGSGSILYGCRISTGRRMRLDDAFDDGYTTSSSYDHVRLAGTQVAWISTYTDASCKADCPPGYAATTVRIAVDDVARRRARSIVGSAR